MIEKQGYIKRVGSKYALTSHKTKISDEIVQFYKRMEKKLINNGFIPISTKQISEQFDLSEKKSLEILHYLRNQKKLVKVDADLWMHSENVDKLYLLNKNHFKSNNELDGYVMSIVHDLEKDQSKLIIIDAENFSDKPIAEILLPQRVPFGAHGSWLEN